jgi:lysophospholipase L1-like esterase
VLVALGCPKQEIFMHEAARAMRPAVLLGIGAGLDFWAGTARRAPPWVSRAGLEWLYRLVHEPRRLWRRYLVRDPAFLGVLAHDLQARSAAKRTPTAVPALRVALAGGSLAGALPEHLDLPGVLLDPRGDAAAPASHVLVIGGADDLARSGDDATFFVDRTRELVDSLQARSPRPEVILCSVPPAGADRTELNDEILAANRGLLSLVEERGLAWIDLHGMLRDDRAPAAAIDARFSRDGLHLRGPAYRLLRDALAAELGQPSPRLPADAARDAGALVRDAAVHRGVHSIDRALHRDLFARELDPERDRVALLFFGDVERDALVPGDRAARRLARQVRHALAHRQRHSGFTVAFQALCRALSRAGYRVVVNDAALARANPHHPIGIAGYPHILERWDLPNPAVLGPGLFDHPGLAPHLQGDPRFVSYLVPEGWMSDLFRRSWGDFCRPWHAGVDLSSWPSFRAAPKDIDALVYAKFLWGRAHGDRVLLAPLLASLERRGLRAHVLRYGAYEPGEYRALLRRSRAMIYLCEHETQGIACAEAMACDVPVLAWDQGRWLDPVRLRFGDADVPASSVPYFDARCGDRFAGPEDLDAALDRFFPSLDGYTPRAFVADRLSLDRSAQLYVAALREAASSPRR